MNKGIRKEHKGLVVVGKETNMKAEKGSKEYEETLKVLIEEYGKEGLKPF